jgi:hypothetical protein
MSSIGYTSGSDSWFRDEDCWTKGKLASIALFFYYGRTEEVPSESVKICFFEAEIAPILALAGQPKPYSAGKIFGLSSFALIIGGETVWPDGGFQQ